MEVENRERVATSEVHWLPSSNPSDRILASIVSAFERFGSFSAMLRSTDPVVIEAEREWHHRRVGLFHFASGSSYQQVSVAVR